MRILHISYSDSAGGAAKAAYDTHRLLIKNNHDSKMLVCQKLLNDPTVFTKPYKFKFLYQIELKLKKGLSYLIKFLQRNDNTGLHTLGLFSIISAKYINAMDVEIVHLHWINFEMLSIKEISKIEKPICWTFHDFWPILGSEHAHDLNGFHRYIEGYNKSNNRSKGLDIDRFIFRLKRRYLSDKDIVIILPSNVSKNVVERSLIFRSQTKEVIPNFIPEGDFLPLDKKEARRALNLKEEGFYVLCIAYEVTSFLKGGDLLEKILGHDFGRTVNFLLVGKNSKNFEKFDATRSIGLIDDEEVLNKYYSASDLFLMPSRQESFSLTALESLLSGTPVVSFEVGATPEIVSHERSGYLAQEMNAQSLIDGIEHHLEKTLTVTNEDLVKIKEKFDESVVLDKLMRVYGSSQGQPIDQLSDKANVKDS